LKVEHCIVCPQFVYTKRPGQPSAMMPASKVNSGVSETTAAKG